ncbi:MAG: TenA family transcriptional regulator [Leptolyngbya foveolarum]|uniref:TenA family transcriptional regulator n=1 Tax=Leptolyngbya foveolarum TaxID=47253 RepID=A0A2W4UNH1_9CYAN|nr:MAG: TenA family transcriptional regulator [Leptolyngbya foveolarum]
MSLSKILWQTNQDLAVECLQHPFVQRIGDGSLPKSIFVYYIEQDVFFLEAFAKAYSIAAAKSPDWKSFQVFHDLAGGVLTELELHHEYAKSWGVDISAIAPKPATRQYTDFLLSTAWSQPVGITAVAMSPCMRLYAYLGQQLAANGIPSHSYENWIETYSSDEFEPLAKQLEALVDGHSSDTPLVRSTYRYAMTCERDFFQAAMDS